MGMFDSLYAKLKCPKTGVEEEVEIQFKWSRRLLNRYKAGDALEWGPYGNLWIEEDYLCDGCSKYEPFKIGGKVIAKSVKSAVFHDVYIHLEQGKILEVLSKKDFKKRFLKGGRMRLPKGQRRVNPKSLVRFF